MSEPPPPALVNVPAPAPSAPDWAFLLAHPAHGVALGFGSGLLRAAWLVVLTLTFVLGALCAQRTGTDLGRADDGAIVIDEIVAIWVVLLLLPPTLLAQLLGVLAFRFFDIVKPPPIGIIDRRFKNGFGVMADDLVAAFYALLTAAVLVRVLA